jgi:ketosteroid isomerase-like protein
MPQDNIDFVRSIYEAWERGDWGSVDWADPEIEYVMVDEPGAAPQHGVAAMTRAWGQFLAAWEGYRLEADEYRALDDERVLVLVRALGKGKASGLDLAQSTQGRRGANVFHIRDGRVTRLAAYVDAQRALADLGAQ